MANTISSLEDLTDGSDITEGQIKRLIAKLDIKIHNILHDGGDHAALDTKTMGETGLDVKYSTSLEAMLKLRAYYAELLASPEKRGDYALLFSQVLPLVDEVPNESDFPSRYS